MENLQHVPGIGFPGTRYTIVVPMFTPDGAHNIDYIDAFVGRAIDIAGGATSYIASGYWHSGGETFDETVTVILVDVAYPSSASQIEELLPQLKRDTDQVELYVTTHPITRITVN